MSPKFTPFSLTSRSKNVQNVIIMYKLISLHEVNYDFTTNRILRRLDLLNLPL